MRLLKKLALTCSIVLLASCTANQVIEQVNPEPRSYSTQPLADPLFSWAEVVAGSNRMNNWLVAHQAELSTDNTKGPREYLYYLISSQVSHILQRDQSIWPKSEDPVLAQLFYWSQQLGAFGGPLVFNNIKPASMPHADQVLEIPSPFKLKLEGSNFKLSSKAANWSAHFPYYFMIQDLFESQDQSGNAVTVATIATGAASDNTSAGRSQATIMLIHSPTADHEAFVETWAQAMNIQGSRKTKALNFRELESSYAYDPSIKMHMEAGFIKSKSGSFAFIFAGNDGTYQKNRVHFLDFLQHLQLPE